MKVALYARVSTRGKGQDVENQLMVLREYCQKMDYEIYHEFIDMESGASPTRKEFGKMFADAAKRKFDMVLFWSLDRFSREGCRRTIQYLQQLDDSRVIYKSYTEQYLDSSGIFRDVIISLLSVLAQQEKIRLSERVRAGLDKAKSKGRVGGRPRIQQEVIDQIVVLNQQGLSMRKIGKAVNIHHRTVAQYLTG